VKVGYARVSTKEQSFDLQIDALKKVGCEKIYAVATKRIPGEALIDLHRRSESLPPRSGERRALMQEVAQLNGVSESTLYCALRQRLKPRAMQQSDRGIPRVMSIS
jgi:predicted site-specific integrase-resolvase